MVTIPNKCLLSLGSIINIVLIVCVWILAYLISSVSLVEGILLVINQFLLTILVFSVLILNMPKKDSAYGPCFMFFWGLHVLIYYNISNVIPSLLPELRPENLVVRIPNPPVWAFSYATIAAIIMLLGVGLGVKGISIFWPQMAQMRSKERHPWLPNYRLSMLSCLALILLVVYGTLRYGAQVAATTLTDETIAGMKLSEQLLFHGLFTVLPIAPILATFGYLSASSRGKQKNAGFLIVVASIVTLMALLVWGQRSTAMLSLAMPVGLLVSVGKIHVRKIIIPFMLLIVLIYSVVTLVRDSQLIPLIALTPDMSQLSFNDIASAVSTKRGHGDSVATRALADLSYRTAGLEAVASLMSAQSDERLSLQAGKTVLTGFANALPASIRPENISARIKTAPASYGVFEPGDWVTSILAEFVLDFGPLLLFFPAVMCGALLSLIDRVLLSLGQHPYFEGLLIMRIVFFVFIISNGGSLSEMTLMLFKGTVGFSILFVALGFLSCFLKKLPKRLLFCRIKGTIDVHNTTLI